MKNIAIIVAAGRGHRAAFSRGPKQYAEIGGRAVLDYALGPFVTHPQIDGVQVVIHADDRAHYDRAVRDVAPEKLMPAVTGGESRQQSVLAGLRAIGPLAPQAVLIHDAARPFVAECDVDQVLGALKAHAGAIVAVPVADTLKREQGPHSGRQGAMIGGTLERAGLWFAQTPQAFRYRDIVAAHEAALAGGRTDFTDDASIAEAAGLDVALVEGHPRNFKITTPADIERAEREVGMMNEFRTGSGFDVHKFTDGDHVWLCGVLVPHGFGLLGHSDADVGLHALVDAIFGAIADGDIGAHFPPSDPKWRGAASEIFVRYARDRVRARGGVIVHVDVTLMCEEPKIGPHRDVMRGRVAELLEIDVARVSVKATTTEGLGFTGRREGIAAMATATVRLA